MLRIAIANGKGGTAKTSTTVHLADALASQGARVLVVDLDDQAQSTKFLGAAVEPDGATVAELLLQKARLEETLVAVRSGTRLVPSRRGLEKASHELISAYYGHERLAKALEAGQGHFEVALFDCPPALSILTANALHAADWMLIPTELDAAAYDGLTDLREFAAQVRRGPLASSILISNYDARNRRNNSTYEPALAEEFNVLPTRIPTCQSVPQSHGALCELAKVNPRSRAWGAFREVATDIIALCKEVHVAA